jgi:hypothetical protein
MRWAALLLLLGCAGAHPSRPECGGPTGGHGPALAGSGGFTLRGPPGGVAPGATAALTLRGPVPFRGFLVTPAEAAHGGGAFASAPTGTRLICGGVGHASAASKDAVTLPWRAPAKEGDVAMRFFVVVGAAEWYGPLSASIAVHGAANATKAPPL